MEEHNIYAMWIAGGIFAITFIIILSEKIHRTIIALAGASIMVMVGMYMNFYSQEEALESIDFNTLGLLMGMMILVSMLQKTGFFEYLAIITAKKTKGNPWLLVVFLGTITTVLSMIIDNVTTIVLIAPVTVIIAEMLGINPIPLLMAEALLSDTGGVATLVGDPPNILIGSAAHLSFNDFLIHLAPVVFVIWLVTLFLLKFIFRKEMAEKPKHIDALQKMDEKAALKDPKALKKILFSLGVVIILFFVHHHLGLLPSFVAMIGAGLALMLVQPNPDDILHDVHWTVLLFFASLFVVVGGIERAGLLDIVATRILSLAAGNLLVTCVVVIWVAAICSAIVDNIPFTMAMIPVIQYLETKGINVSPLWWALAMGVGFGGNGTPIGSTANVVTVSISERTNFPITFKIWFKSGSQVMLATCAMATVIMIVFFKWFT